MLLPRCLIGSLLLIAGAACGQPAAPDPAALAAQGAQAMRERLQCDVREAQAAIQGSKLPEADRLKLLDSAAQLAAEIERLPGELPPGFRTIMPFSDLQARIFALHAPVNRGAGIPPLTVWANDRWDLLFPTQAPTLPVTPPSLRVDMMRGEHRAAAFNLTNSTDQPMVVTVTLPLFPGGAWISVREVQFTETYSRRVIAAGLPLAKHAGDDYVITLPPGMTKQVWLAMAAPKTGAINAGGNITIAAPGQPTARVPLRVHVSRLQFPARPSIAIGGWDYCDGPQCAFDAGNLDQKTFIAKLREYWVDMPWGGGQPSGAEFAADGRMTRSPSFAPWDEWIAKFPDARHFGVFGLGKDFENANPHDPRTARMVADFLKAWVEHLQGQGLKPAQLCLLVSDEPRNAETDDSYVSWAATVRDANTGVTIWVDPCHDDPAQADPRVYSLSDVLSPSAARFVGSPQSYRDFFVKQQQEAGKELWFYSCVNGKHLDPIIYHRGQFWLAIKYGAKGSSYWAFGDEGRAGSSYRAYTSPGHMFSPLFLDPETGITDGKHMEAIREGAEDFETFAMLRRRVSELQAQGVQSEALTQAGELLTAGPDRVCSEITIDKLDWHVAKQHGTMDEVRREALQLLEKLSG